MENHKKIQDLEKQIQNLTSSLGSVQTQLIAKNHAINQEIVNIVKEEFAILSKSSEEKMIKLSRDTEMTLNEIKTVSLNHLEAIKSSQNDKFSEFNKNLMDLSKNLVNVESKLKTSDAYWDLKFSKLNASHVNLDTKLFNVKNSVEHDCYACDKCMPIAEIPPKP